MATFYLDVDDEITSAADRIRRTDDRLVALVLPPGSRVATSRINFRLLAREAQSRQRRLVIVAPDAAVRALASSAGLPTFGSVGEYEAAEADMAGRGDDAATEAAADQTATVAVAAAAAATKPRASGPTAPASVPATAGGAARGHALHDARTNAGPEPLPATARRRRRVGVGGVILVGVIALLLVAGGVGAYLFVPSASIVVSQREELLGPYQLAVRIDPAAGAVDDANLVVPGIRRDFPLQQAAVFTATGARNNDTKATGTVTFTSKNTVFKVPVPAGTRISTADGTAFVTKASVSVPAANFDTQVAGTADAPIEAVRAGPGGNVGAGAIVNVPSDLASFKVSVSNAKGTTGGTHQVITFVQQSDVDGAKATLSQKIGDQFQAELADPNAVPSNLRLFRDTATLGPTAFDPDPASLVNQQLKTFELVATSSGSATAGDLDGVKSLVTRVVERRLSQGYHLVDGSTAVTLGDATLEGATVVVAVAGEARQVRDLDRDAMIQAIKGKPVAEARTYLAQFGAVTLSVDPGWMSTVPGFEFRIDLRIVAPVPAASPPRPGTSASASAAASASAPASAPGTVEPSAQASASVTGSPPASAPASIAPTASPSAP